jgi:hypothetical protein
MAQMDNRKFRRRLIARVEALRIEFRLPKLVFNDRIGPVAAKRARFEAASDDEAWNHFPLKYMDRIAGMFGIGGVSGGGRRGHLGGLVRARPLMAGSGE